MKTSLPVDGPIRTATLEPTRLIVFFLIAFGFTWLFWMPNALAKMGTIPASPLTELGFVGAFGPLVAAIIVTSIYEGKSGLLVLFKRAVDYSFKKRWWFFVTLLFPLLVFLAFLMGIVTDGTIPPSQALSEPWILFPAFFSVLFLSGPFEEEFGWRGYALPRLQAKFNALLSSLILGVIWALWHIPQFLIPGNGMFYKTPLWTFIPTVVAATILFSWVYNNTNGSLLAMLLVHTTFNLSMFVFPVLDTSLGYVYVLVVFLAAALVMTGIFSSRTLQREE
jgi:membrane protease YdiL (CAAX protease family)